MRLQGIVLAQPIPPVNNVLKDNEREVFRNTFKALHAKDYITFKLTGKFVTDYSDASGTNLFDIRKKE